MKTFTYVVALATSLSLASATGPTYSPDTGKYTCPIPNGVYCSGNIIIRCKDGFGQPGNCNDNLAGQPPLGVGFAECYAPPGHEGVGACAKNCVVYGDSGNLYNKTFPQPGCKLRTTSIPPVSLPSPSAVTIYSTVTTTDFIAVCPTASSTNTIVPPPISLTTVSSSSSATVPPPVSLPTVTSVVVPPPATLTTTSSTSTWVIIPTGTGTGVPPPPNNGTMTTWTRPTSATATPSGPKTTTTSSAIPGAAVINTPGSGAALAAMAFAAAWFL